MALVDGCARRRAEEEDEEKEEVQTA